MRADNRTCEGIWVAEVVAFSNFTNLNNYYYLVTGDAACLEPNNCTQLCYINNEMQICTCERGYQIDSNGISCNGKLILNGWTVSYLVLLVIDVDECSMTESPCSQDCSNTDGSFVCSCANGYTLDSDGRACNGKQVTRVVVNNYVIASTFVGVV